MNSKINTKIFLILCIVVFAIIGFVFRLFLSLGEMYVVWPVIASCCAYLIFSYCLWRKINTSIFGEIGFIYLGLALAYTVLPAFTVILANFIIPIGIDGGRPLVLHPEPVIVGEHFWRHTLFISGVAIGYLVVRGGNIKSIFKRAKIEKDNRFIVCGVLSILLMSIICVILLSAPVTTYYEHYTRFEHLSSPMLKFVQFCLLVKSGGYFVLMALMFNQYDKYKWLIYVLVPVLCVFEVVYSFGSRIEALIILIAFAGFFHYKKKPLSLRSGLIYLFILAAIFSAVELVRSAQLNNQSVESMVSDEGIKAASEFGAVFNTGMHLYSERQNGGLPNREWPMFIYEFISLIPFVDHTEYHPQYWYARYYFPNSIVPPQTMGVISDSAIWGGEIDLLIRSVMNGMVFGLLTRWFIRRKDKWVALSIYIYVYATCVMTLKYSIFYQMPMVIKILMPSVFIAFVLIKFRRSLSRRCLT
jgi:hypothetical protein